MFGIEKVFGALVGMNAAEEAMKDRHRKYMKVYMREYRAKKKNTK